MRCSQLVLLLRHQPHAADAVLASFGEAARASLTAIAKSGAASPLNSHLLLRLLTAAEQVPRSPIPALPLELAIIDVTATK